MLDDKKLEEWEKQLTDTKKEDSFMKKADVDKKQTEINKKVKQAKETVQKRVTQLNRGPLKSVPDKSKADKKPAKEPDSQTWLQKYIADPEASGAKLITSLLCRESGATIDECVAKATTYGQKKNPPSRWGQSKSSIRSHIRYLASKNCEIIDLGDDRFKVTQK